MMVPRVPVAPWMVALMVLLSSEVQGEAPPENHLLRALHECHAERDGTQRYLMRCVFNREEFMRFDSAVGEFRALTAMGRPWAAAWNSQKDYLERRRAEVDTVCAHNYELNQGFTMKRRGEGRQECQARPAAGWWARPSRGAGTRAQGLAEPAMSRASPVQPEVHVSPAKKVALEHRDLLICHVTDFYPGSIRVRWFRNGQEETAGVVSTELIRNGDWTFQVLVMLEMTPHRGDAYTCRVEHPSLQSPVTVEWRVQSDSARNKMLAGAGGLVLGLIFLAVGIVKHMRSKQAQGRSPGSR
ncbi:HLA class II histocompatibility antigen, DP beta 1 chain-like isoform X1 [Meriones unguiculatus]|uniref:HLA class II histocompatibility antigen, DP beta 1 chain-like isoform X1 n=1 Tax=Meriones unguiculatus TaxID=10047 RepID=UPI00293F56DF|nr:HLA class II histocompatibility antigen, DP beta 1 chain-like isoform X1 [Meriones unguiculatus]